ncbi:MAG: aldolase/citrate lyase family protein [Nitratireductor sp.]
MIFDLEDSVAPHMAATARNNLRELQRTPISADVERVIRISGHHSPGFGDDSWSQSLNAGRMQFFLPKLENPEGTACRKGKDGKAWPGTLGNDRKPCRYS